MKTMNLKIALLTSLLPFFAGVAHADVLEDFDKLGGNDVLMEKAKALEPDQTISIVQDRVVNRNKRFEVSPEFTSVLGGDSYMSSRGYGVNGHFHINPHWSVGAKWATMRNELSPEGKNLITDSSILGKNIVPEMDYPKDQWMATLNYYPIYGKLNLFDKGIAHFDVYGLAGYGKINLKSGSKNTWTAGGGIGFWVSQHLTTRLEMRYQTYEATRQNGGTKMDITAASLQVGYLL